MVTEIERVAPQQPDWLQRKQEQSAPSTNRNINDIYWRKPDGWIVTGPSAVRGADGRCLTMQAESLIRRGWEPLIDYSYTNRVSDRTGHRETIEINEDRLNTPDRYYWLFANGGAHLFSIEQIVAHHWHITPPFGLPKSAFPQLEEWEVPSAYYCPACTPGTPPLNSIEECVKHLMVRHQMNLIQVRDLQEATADFSTKPHGAAGMAIRRKAKEQEKAVATAIPQSMPRLIICDQCGEHFADGLSKARHMKKEHPKGD